MATFRSKTEADRHFLSLAMKERANSDDPKARLVLQSGVGALIVKNGAVLSRSANVLPTALKERRDESLSISDDERYHFIEHAERAAIYRGLLSLTKLEGSTIYCTRFPCSDCARSIVWAGIKRAVFATGYGGEVRWLESQRAAVQILRTAGITVRVLTASDNGGPAVRRDSEITD